MISAVNAFVLSVEIFDTFLKELIQYYNAVRYDCNIADAI